MHFVCSLSDYGKNNSVSYLLELHDIVVIVCSECISAIELDSYIIYCSISHFLKLTDTFWRSSVPREPPPWRGVRWIRRWIWRRGRWIWRWGRWIWRGRRVVSIWGGATTWRRIFMVSRYAGDLALSFQLVSMMAPVSDHLAHSEIVSVASIVPAVGYPWRRPAESSGGWGPEGEKKCQHASKCGEPHHFFLAHTEMR